GRVRESGRREGRRGRGVAAGAPADGHRGRLCGDRTARTAQEGPLMRAVLATARTEWVRYFRDRIAMFTTLALPVVLVLLIGLSFGQSSDRLPVGMLLSDPGPLGTSLVAELEQSPAIDVQQYDDRNDMYRDIRMGLLAGGVDVPADGEPVQIY